MAEFEERADQLSLDAIDQTLADGSVFRKARGKLLGPGAKLLVGPRGTGKTHLMRYAYLHAIRHSAAPVAFYANFSKYLNLEPLLASSTDALKRFHSWVVAKLILSAFELLRDSDISLNVLTSRHEYFEPEKLAKLVGLLERGTGGELYESLGRNLTVTHALATADAIRKHLDRKRAVFLLDDAALSLSEPYLIAFFEIYRLLKTENVSPKASVYPGSTQYGPTFHASHEVEEIPLWLAVDDPEYSGIMSDIATKRFSQQEIETVAPDNLEFLKYIAFGTPRAYLTLVRQFLDSNSGTVQQRLNRVVEKRTELVGTEYESLAIKLVQFATVIQTGRNFFDAAVAQVARAQHNDQSRRNIVFGLQQTDSTSPLVRRMLRFLVEVGMLYPLQTVSHGPDRKYDRFVPHLAFLQAAGAFRTGRGFSARDLVQFMQKPPSKHPVRRELGSLLGGDAISNLRLDLPPCQVCKSARMSESQRFCHNCGAQLLVASLFESCMQLPLEQVPGISDAMIRRIHADTRLRSIGDVYASQNAAGELQQASYVGPKRATGIVTKVGLAVAEFLS